MPCADDGRYSNSYDIFLRGEEICSGAQRVHVPEMLEAAVVAKTGKVDAGLRPYIDSMRHGMPPHGGAGIGLERLVFLYLNLDNVRKASMFPRTPGAARPEAWATTNNNKIRSTMQPPRQLCFLSSGGALIFTATRRSSLP